MCGIYITNIPYDREDVYEKLNSINFRGPNNTGTLNIDDLILGHLRLSIIDLDEQANQPMKFQDLHIVYNGEIFNYLVIKEELINLGCQFTTESDTEVLLQGYKIWGKGVLDKLNGMFSFCIYDANKNKVFAARDRLGIKPFYYYWKEGTFEICSQLRPLINDRSEISSEAVSIYLDCGYVPSPYSIILDVYKLPPGNFMEIDLETKSFSIKEFWNLKPVAIRNISYEEAKKELHDLLIDSVKMRMQSDVPLGTFLSGGVDSALISAIAAKNGDKPLKTFTIGFDDLRYDESKRAEKFAEIIGSDHTTILCNPDRVLEMLPKLIKVYDEPFADSSALPSLLLNSVTKSYVTVVLSGDGGDESFFGYNHIDMVSKLKWLLMIPRPIRKMFSNFGWHRLMNIGKPETVKEVIEIKDIRVFSQKIHTGFNGIQQKQYTNWFKYYEKCSRWSDNPLQQITDLTIKLQLENDFNVKVDRASMASSVEVRCPLQDYRIVEFARNLPEKYKYNKGKKKRILKDILKEYIPEEVFEAPKKGFSIPLADWIRKELKDDVLKELNEEFLRRVPNLNVPKFKDQLNQHMNQKANYSTNIWKVFILSKWYKEFGF